MTQSSGSGLTAVTPPLPRTLEWIGDTNGCLRLIDQTRLPGELVYLDCRDVDTVWEAIKMLRVRGAPAIGVAAAYGVVVGLPPADSSNTDRDALRGRIREVVESLSTSRPTAVNLFWALDRMSGVADQIDSDQPAVWRDRLLSEARQIDEEDQQMCRAIGAAGAPLLAGLDRVLTHCNAGGLATAGDGTALSVIFAAAAQNTNLSVFADETRPLLQGARLTAWELAQRRIPVTVLCDSAAGWAMHEGRIQAVVTGADRIAANGDAANKIGTFSVATLAHAHHIPFYVAAPSSTFDLSLASGAEIPIEQRAASEVVEPFGQRIAPEGVDVFNPAFDVTPARLITALITERGVIQPVNEEAIRHLLQTQP